MTTARNLKWMFSILALTGACAQAAPVFEQVSTAVSTSWTSQLGVGQGAYQTFDDFKLGHDAAINKVTWQGTYFSADAGGLHGAAPNTNTWTIEFWSGDAGGPKQQLYSQDYNASNALRSNRGPVTLNNLTFDLYDFELDLTQAFDVMAGQTYWFSVMSKSTSFSPFFSWTSSDSPGNSWQRMFDGNGQVLSSNARSGNRAFDEYRDATLRRLEEEERDFRDFLDRLRMARDKAEFDQFLAERRRNEV